MILNYVDKKEGGGGYKVVFVNLAMGAQYTIAENGDDEPFPISWIDLESLIATEVAYVTEELEQLMTKMPATEKELADMRRLDNKLKYLLNYEHVK